MFFTSGKNVLCKHCLHFRGKLHWSSNGLLIIRVRQRQQLGRSRILPGVGGLRQLKTTGVTCSGLLACKKGRGHPALEDQKIVEIHMPLCWILKGFVLLFHRETFAQMIEENLNCLGHLSTIIREANEEQGSSMMVSFVWLWTCILGMLGVKALTFQASLIWHSRCIYREQSSEERAFEEYC